MNKSYIENNDKVVVSSDEGKIIERSNESNIHEILQTENAIKKIKSEIEKKSIEKAILLESKKNTKNLQYLLLYGAAGVAFIVLLLNPVLNWRLATTFGPLNGAEIAGVSMELLLFGVIAPSYFFLTHKHKCGQKIKALEEVISFLKSELENHEKRLEQLKKESVIENKIAPMQKIDDSIIKDLDIKIKTIYLYWLRNKKYFKLYKKGILDTKLDKKYNYDNSQVEMTNELLLNDKEKLLTLK